MDATAAMLKHLPSPISTVAMSSSSSTVAPARRTMADLPEAMHKPLLAAEADGNKCSSQGLQDNDSLSSHEPPQLQSPTLDGSAWPDAKSIEMRLVGSAVDLLLLQESCV
jgi:hypothetical protein